MTYLKIKTPRRMVTKKKKTPLVSAKRFLSFLLLSLILGISICAVGYVIFFSTVFAQEIPKQQEAEIVFEEPDPPVHDEPIGEQVETEKQPTKKELPKVAIIIDDLGYHKKLGEKFLNFPYELTYSFLPFAPYTAKQEEMAFNSGKTVLLHLPLEPKGKKWDPGPGTLFLSDSPEVQKEKFEKALAQVSHAVGVNNHMGSLFTGNTKAMMSLLGQFADKGLFFVDSVTASESVGYSLAQKNGVQSARRDVFLDNVLDEQDICNRLKELVETAKKKGWAIGIAHPHRVSAEAVLACGKLYLNEIQYVSILDVL
jgi:polysaccharide deacetylase 2 family uncharacterized protein YibQ